MFGLGKEMSHNLRFQIVLITTLKHTLTPICRTNLNVSFSFASKCRPTQEIKILRLDKTEQMSAVEVATVLKLFSIFSLGSPYLES